MRKVEEEELVKKLNLPIFESAQPAKRERGRPLITEKPVRQAQGKLKK